MGVEVVDYAAECKRLAEERDYANARAAAAEARADALAGLLENVMAYKGLTPPEVLYAEIRKALAAAAPGGEGAG